MYFPFRDFAHGAETFHKIVELFHNTSVWGVTVAQKPEVASLNSAVGLVFTF